jgi:hypothetical protein
VRPCAHSPRQSLEFSIPSSFAGTFVAEKTPPLIVTSNGEVIATTPSGVIVALTNPDQSASRWSPADPRGPVDWNYSQAEDLQADSFAFVRCSNCAAAGRQVW